MYGNKETVICCFCGLSLPKKNAVEIQIFALIDENESQQLFCHKACLNQKLHPFVPRHPDLLD